MPPRKSTDTPADKPVSYRAPALDKGLDILEVLAGVSDGLSQAELSRVLGRTPNEFYRMLMRLVDRGYVVRPEPGDRYFLSMKLFALSTRHPPVERLTRAASPLMRILAEQVLQSCHLAIHDHGTALIVVQENPPGPWAYTVARGSRIALGNTGSGHVLLAFQSPETFADMLEAARTTEPDNTYEADALTALCADIRRQGYVSSSSAQVHGVTNLSAPVRDHEGHAVAALTIPFLPRVDGMAAADLPQTLDALLKTADKLSRSLAAQSGK